MPWVKLGVGIVLVILVAGLAVYLNSDSFRDRVRRHLISELEAATDRKSTRLNSSH